MIDNIVSVVGPPNGIPEARWNKSPDGKALGDFDLLIDEELMEREDVNSRYDKCYRFKL